MRSIPLSCLNQGCSRQGCSPNRCLSTRFAFPPAGLVVSTGAACPCAGPPLGPSLLGPPRHRVELTERIALRNRADPHTFCVCPKSGSLVLCGLEFNCLPGRALRQLRPDQAVGRHGDLSGRHAGARARQGRALGPLNCLPGTIYWVVCLEPLCCPPLKL